MLMQDYKDTPEGILEDVLGNKLQIIGMVLDQFRHTHRLTLSKCNMMFDAATAILVAVASFIATSVNYKEQHED